MKIISLLLAVASLGFVYLSTRDFIKEITEWMNDCDHAEIMHRPKPPAKAVYESLALSAYLILFDLFFWCMFFNV